MFETLTPLIAPEAIPDCMFCQEDILTDVPDNFNTYELCLTP